MRFNIRMNSLDKYINMRYEICMYDMHKSDALLKIMSYGTKNKYLKKIMLVKTVNE